MNTYHNAAFRENDNIRACAFPVEDPAPCGTDGELLSSDLYSVSLLEYGVDIYNGFFTPIAANQCYPQMIDGVVAQACVRTHRRARRVAEGDEV